MTDAQKYFPWEIGKLPFNWGPLKEPTNGPGLPDLLPFGLELDPNTFHLKQVPLSETSQALELAYRSGSQISGIMDESGIGRQYADDFLEFVCAVHGSNNFKDVSVLEIGCGTGYLLHRLSVLGAQAVGIEPGAHGRESVSKYGTKILTDFFPSKKIKGKFDFIVFYAVLEHFERPGEFLANVQEFLSPVGKIALAVPNCEPYIEAGDLSMLLHEHWNYFTRDSLRALISMYGGDDVKVVSSRFGGCHYASAKMGVKKQRASAMSEADILELTLRAIRFRQKANASAARLERLLNSNRKNGLSTGIFVPGRAVNTLEYTHADLTRCRFFDDNPHYQGCYFPGIPVVIEPRHALVADPTDMVIIMSRTFGDKIGAELERVLPRKTKLITWSDIYAPKSLGAGSH